MKTHWAHIDVDGYPVSWGVAVGNDLDYQVVPEGLTRVECPPDVNSYDGWRYVSNEWIQE